MKISVQITFRRLFLICWSNLTSFTSNFLILLRLSFFPVVQIQPCTVTHFIYLVGKFYQVQLPVLGKNSLYVHVLILRILLSCHFDNTKQAFFFTIFVCPFFLNIFIRLRCVRTILKLTTLAAADESIKDKFVCAREKKKAVRGQGVSGKSSCDAKYSAGCELTSFGYIPRNWEYYFFFFSFYEIVFIEMFIFVFSFLRTKTQKFIFFYEHIGYMSEEKSITSSSRIRIPSPSVALHKTLVPKLMKWQNEGGKGVSKEQQKHVREWKSLLTNGTALRKREK